MTSLVLCRAERLLEQSASTGAVLGLDTGISAASLGLIAGSRIVGTMTRSVTSHGASLPGAVDELLAKGGIKFRDLSAIAVGIGPGSFTGLRIGVAYAKGLAMAAGCQIIGVPGFDAYAAASMDHAGAKAHLIPGRLLCVVTDARKREVYAALYRVRADGLEKLSEAMVIALEQLASRITEDVLLVGDSTARDAAALIGTLGHGVAVAVVDSETLEMRGASVAAIGVARLARGETDRAASLEPLYIRTPEATYKPVTNPAKTGTEGLWSSGKNNSFGSI